MEKFDNIQQYMENWQRKIQTLNIKCRIIEDYIRKLIKEMEEVINKMSTTTFWELFPQVLGIDARLALLSELAGLIKDIDLEPNELIEWVEKDYASYNKELCGYSLNMKPNCSLIFHVV